MRWGARRRKAALWAVLAADAWLKLDKALQAEKSLDLARRLYGADGGLPLPFEGMQAFLGELRDAVLACRLAARGFEGEGNEGDEGGDEGMVEEVSETLDRSPMGHRKSLIGAVGGPPLLDAGALGPIRGADDEPGFRDDQFE